jgi:WD40 repeat protein
MPGVNGGGRTKALGEVWLGEVDDHVIDLAWSPVGDQLAAASTSGPVSVFEGASGEVRHNLAGHRFGTTALSWSPHGATLASAGQDGLARAWDTATGAERFRVEGGSAWVERVAWSPPGDVLATAAGKSLRLWDAWGKLLLDAPPHPSTIADIRWRPRSHELASAAYGRLSLWKHDKPGPTRSFEWKGSMLALAWSPDGRYIATGDQDATVHFWIVKTGEDLMMYGYPTKVRELSWDSVGRYLATGGGPQATVWDCSGKGPAGRTPLSLDRRRSLITALAFRPSGAVLAVGGQDGAVRVWRVGKEGERLAAVNLGAEVTKLAWHPSGRVLAAATATGTVAVFETPWI